MAKTMIPCINRDDVFSIKKTTNVTQWYSGQYIGLITQRSKYHYSHRFFYLSDAAEADREVHDLDSTPGGPCIPGRILVRDTVRLGVWLGWHICQTIMQVS